MLTNPSLTISSGTALTGGGSVALGSSTTLSLDTTKVPLLAAANTFATNQPVKRTITAISSSPNFGVHGASGNSSLSSYPITNAGVWGDASGTLAPIGVIGNVRQRPWRRFL
jgi:hypothetical protein